MSGKEPEATFNIGRTQPDGGSYSCSYMITHGDGGHEGGSGAFGDTIPKLAERMKTLLRGRDGIRIVLRSKQGPLGLAGEAHRVWPVPDDQLRAVAEALRRERSDLEITLETSK